MAAGTMIRCETQMRQQTRAALTRPSTWSRLASYLLFYFLLIIAAPVLLVTSLAGWIHLLLKGRRHDELAGFGDRLGDWLGDATRFVAGSSEQRPFPFEDADLPLEQPKPYPAARQDRPGRETKPAPGAGGKTKRARTAATGKKRGKKKKRSKPRGGKS